MASGRRESRIVNDKIRTVLNTFMKNESGYGGRKKSSYNIHCLPRRKYTCKHLIETTRGKNALTELSLK